jgi:ABC-type bacteriocin/lantibiotic exporter with double-glycine peptidase domain
MGKFSLFNIPGWFKVLVSPTIPQYHTNDCAVACLHMIARYYGQDPTGALLSAQVFRDEQGTKVADLVQAGQALGLEGTALVSDNRELPTNRNLPGIIHTFKDQAYHYQVLWRVGRRWSLVSDPARGKRWIKTNHLRSLWTGGMVVFTPGTQFAKDHWLLGPLGPFFQLLGEWMSELLLVCGLSVVLILGYLGQFIYYRYLVDHIIPAGLVQSLGPALIAVLIALVIQVVSRALRDRILATTGASMDYTLLGTYFSHVLKVTQGFYDRYKKGEIAARMEDAKHIRQVVAGTALSLVLDTLLVGVLGVVLFVIMPELTLVSLAIIPGYALVVGFLLPRYQKEWKRLLAINTQCYSHVIESVQGSLDLKANQAEAFVLGRGLEQFVGSAKQNIRLDRLEIYQRFILETLEQGVRLGVLALGALRIIQGSLTLGQLISFQLIIGNFLGPLGQLLSLQPALQGAAASGRRLREILREPEEGQQHSEVSKISNQTFIQDESGNTPITLTIENLSFGYNRGRTTLSNITLKAEPGTLTGIIGPSGSGKSSLGKLLLGYYPFEQGAIRLNGRDIRDMDGKHLRSRVGYVPQDLWLFSGSLWDNLTMGVKYGYEQVLKACTWAGLVPWIEQLPQRFSTLITEGGKTLSGGEKQRIGIARCLLRSAHLLVFDESANALDRLNRSRFIETLGFLKSQEKTLLLICHDMDLASKCDQLWVLDRGEVKEAGNPVELEKQEGLYWQFCHSERTAGP